MKKKYAVFIIEGLILLLLCSINRNIIIAYVWIILHEAAHILVAILFNIKVKKFNIHLTGVSCSFSDFDYLNENKKMILYSAGPIFNLISLIVLIIVKEYFHEYYCIDNMILINLLLFIFNMLPAYPLDGCRIYEVLLARRIMYKDARKILMVISFIVAGCFGILFLVTLYIHKINFSILIASMFIILSTISEKKKTNYILLNDLFNKEVTLKKRQYIENRFFSVSDDCTLIKCFSFIDKNKFNYIYVLDEALNVKKIMDETELIDAVKKYGNISFAEYIINIDKETIPKS